MRAFREPSGFPIIGKLKPLGLERHGFQEEKDIKYDIYYIAQLGHIVHLFPEGTWHSDKAAEGSNFEEYLKWAYDGQRNNLI